MAESFTSPKGVILETDFFEGAPKSVKFGVAISRHPDHAGRSGLILPNEDEAAIRLVQERYRAARIIGDSKNELSELRRLDHRSERFVVMQRVGKTAANLFATAKLVHKVDESDILPIEKDFPHVFDTLDPIGCVEISQLASCHPSDFIQQCGFLAVLRAAYGYAISLSPNYLNDISTKISAEERRVREEIESYFGLSQASTSGQSQIGPLGEVSTIVGITEEFVFEHARRFGIETRDLGGPIFKAEAREEDTELYPVAFDLAEVHRVHQSGKNETFNLYLEKIEHHLGLGWFGEGIIENLDFSPI